MTEEIHFTIMGEPVPQGSTRAYVNKKTGEAVTTHGNKNTKVWRQRIATEAQKAQELTPFFENDKKLGYHVTIFFEFTRPASVSKKVKYNNKRPDIDKLIRAVFDGITDILIPDDARIVSVTASEPYAEEGSPPCAKVSVFKMRPMLAVTLADIRKAL